MAETAGQRRRWTLALTVGYGALTAGTVRAYLAPATGFEASIYEATPLSVWALLGFALAVSLLVAFVAAGTRLGTLALRLGGGSVLVVAVMPLVRGYRYYATGEGFLQGSRAIAVAGGSLDPVSLLDPGIHVAAAAIAALAGIGVLRATLVVVAALALCFLVFVPLCCKAITGRTGTAVIGAFVGFCLLPVDQVGTQYMSPQPLTEALLCAPVVIYVLVQYVLADRSFRAVPFTATGGVLALCTFATVLYYPPQGAVFVVVVLVLVAIQVGCRRYQQGGEIRAHRSLAGQTVWFGISLLGWVVLAGPTNDPGIGSLGRTLIGNGVAPLAGAASFRWFDTAPSELFAKLLLIPAAFTILSGGVVIASLLGRSETTEPESTALLRYVSAGGLVCAVGAVIALFDPLAALFVPFVGLLLVFVSILGAIALHRLAGLVAESFSSNVAYQGTTIALGVALVFSLVVLYPSPYVSLDNGHVTDDRLAGYDVALTHRVAGVPICQSGATRYRYRPESIGVGRIVDPTQPDGRSPIDTRGPGERSPVPTDRYLVVTDAALAREAAPGGTPVFSRSLRSSIDSPSVHRVQTGDAMTVYRLRAGVLDDARRRCSPMRRGRSSTGSPLKSVRPRSTGFYDVLCFEAPYHRMPDFPVGRTARSRAGRAPTKAI